MRPFKLVQTQDFVQIRALVLDEIPCCSVQCAASGRKHDWQDVLTRFSRLEIVLKLKVLNSRMKIKCMWMNLTIHISRTLKLSLKQMWIFGYPDKFKYLVFGSQL